MTLYTLRYNEYSNKIVVETEEIVRETATRYYVSERYFVNKDKIGIFSGYSYKMYSLTGDVEKYKELLKSSYQASINAKERQIEELKKTLSVLQDAVTYERKD